MVGLSVNRISVQIVLLALSLWVYMSGSGPWTEAQTVAQPVIECSAVGDSLLLLLPSLMSLLVITIAIKIQKMILHTQKTSSED